MKLIQYHLPKRGKRVGVVTRDDEVIDVTTDETLGVLEILKISHDEGISIGVILADLLDTMPQSTRTNIGDENKPKVTIDQFNNPPDSSKPHLLVPIDTPEVWAFGVTYKRSADMRDDDSASDIYTRVYFSDRPELFYKGTLAHCVGNYGEISIRSDSNFTATEPELAFVLGADGEIVGYTICNDVSAWDIERDNPLYLPQSKIFFGCCAIGPMFVTASEIDDPYDLNIKCTVTRNETAIYEGEVNTSQINRKFDELIEFLTRDNPIPFGTVVSTGTGIITPEDLPLADGDVVSIEIDELGTLVNTVKQL